MSDKTLLSRKIKSICKAQNREISQEELDDEVHRLSDTEHIHRQLFKDSQQDGRVTVKLLIVPTRTKFVRLNLRCNLALSFVYDAFSPLISKFGVVHLALQINHAIIGTKKYSSYNKNWPRIID